MNFFFQLFVFGFLVIIIPTCCALPKPQVQKNGHMLPVEIDEARETKKQEVNYETKRDADLHESVNGGKCQAGMNEFLYKFLVELHRDSGLFLQSFGYF